MRRRLATTIAAVLVTLSFATSVVSACAGWEASADERTACCKAADHDCEGAEADDCCAQKEQGQHALSLQFAAPMLLPDLRTAQRLAAPPPSLRAAFAPAARPAIPRTDTYLLLSVILV